jgi:hypothetical protein
MEKSEARNPKQIQNGGQSYMAPFTWGGWQKLAP